MKKYCILFNMMNDLTDNITQIFHDLINYLDFRKSYYALY
jgi:hypothetical protein